jgi:hypothetical protein
MRCCKIEVDPESGRGYDKLPFDREMRTLIRQVHANTGDRRFEAHYNNPPIERHSLALERRSVAAPIRSNSAFHRPDELAREKLRLRLSLLQRMRA